LHRGFLTMVMLEEDKGESQMGAFTEISTSGLAQNVLQGSARCQPSPKIPTKKLKLKDPQFPPLFSSKPQFTSLAVLFILTI
jgi:hypothetical protein